MKNDWCSVKLGVIILGIILQKKLLYISLALKFEVRGGATDRESRVICFELVASNLQKSVLGPGAYRG